METIIKAHIKRMEVTRKTISLPLADVTEFTTTFEIEGALPIDISHPIFISQEADTND